MSNLTVFSGLWSHLVEVMTAFAPLLVILALFQFFALKLPWSEIAKAGGAILVAIIGFALFLQGVTIGFLPTGRTIGEVVSDLSYNWILIPIGFLLGFVATSAEPAVRVLTYEVEEVFDGSIKGKTLLFTLATGVGVFVALNMARILMGFPLWWVLLPGYIIAFSVAFFADKRFISVAFDAGGVATGPMTVTFILALAISVASTLEGRDPAMEGFGLVALVALAPILSVSILGLVVKRRQKKT